MSTQADPGDRSTQKRSLRRGEGTSINDKASAAEVARARYGAGVVLGGIVAVLAAYWLALRAYHFGGPIKSAANSAAAVVAVLGSITTVIGTIVGAYFGVKVGESGKAEAQQARDKAESKAQKLALVADKNDPVATRILGLNPDFE